MKLKSYASECEQSRAVHVTKTTHVRAKRPVWLPVCFRAVTESINQLITLCTQQAAGQKECDNALRELEVAVLTHTVPHTETLPVRDCVFLIKKNLVHFFNLFFFPIYIAFDSFYIDFKLCLVKPVITYTHITASDNRAGHIKGLIL